MSACIIYNPTARGEGARKFARRIEASAAGCQLRPTTGPDTAPGIAAKAVGEGFDTVIAAGGDGTVNEVLNGIASVPDGLSRVRLGVVPLGTSNVFAKELGLPMVPEEAFRLIAEGRERRVDLPMAEFEGEVGRRRTRHFAQLGGAGLDSRAIAGVSWELKKKVGPLAYVWAGVKTIVAAQPSIAVTVDGNTVHGELVLIGNGRFYGGRIPVFPEARLDSGFLDVRVFPKANVMALARFGFEWLAEYDSRQPGEWRGRVQRIELRAEQPCPLELDGDNVGFLPAVFTIAPGALRVLAA